MTARTLRLTRPTLLAAACGALLAGCGGGDFNMREAVGIDKNPPDAFAVVRHERDLQMPASFGTLPPPDPTARSLVVPDPQRDALEALEGEISGLGYARAVTPASERTVVYAQPAADEAALLSAAGASGSPDDIRVVVNQEAAARQANRREYLLDSVFPGLRNMRGDVLGDPLDPVEAYGLE